MQPGGRTRTLAAALALMTAQGCGASTVPSPISQDSEMTLEAALGPVEAAPALEPTHDPVASPTRGALLPIDPTGRVHAAVHFDDAAFVMRGMRVAPSRRGRAVRDTQYRVRAVRAPGPPRVPTYTLLGFAGTCVVRALAQADLHVEPHTRHDAATDQNVDEVEPCPALREAGEGVLVALEGNHPDARLHDVTSAVTATYPGSDAFQRAGLESPFPSDWAVAFLAVTTLGPLRWTLSRANRARETVELQQILRDDRELVRFVDEPVLPWAVIVTNARSVLVASGDDGRAIFVGFDDGTLHADAWPFPLTEDYSD